jgi:hypothetical protein
MTKNLSQDSQALGSNLNLGPPEYEAGVLTTRNMIFGYMIIIPIQGQEVHVNKKFVIKSCT